MYLFLEPTTRPNSQFWSGVISLISIDPLPLLTDNKVGRQIHSNLSLFVSKVMEPRFSTSTLLLVLSLITISVSKQSIELRISKQLSNSHSLAVGIS